MHSIRILGRLDRPLRLNLTLHPKTTLVKNHGFIDTTEPLKTATHAEAILGEMGPLTLYH